MRDVAPLSGGFMIASIVGFFVSALLVLKYSTSWGVTFMIFFTMMFIAAVISMTYADVNVLLQMERKGK
ncbi:MAG: hypothetical protein ABIG95_05895 [Candidatus Woesearchaeota archaeon]